MSNTVCKRCSMELPDTMFYKHNKSSCKNCVKKATSAYKKSAEAQAKRDERNAKIKSVVVPDGFRLCYICLVAKPLSEFTKMSTRTDKLDTSCRECCNDARRKYREVNIARNSKITSSDIDLTKIKYCIKCRTHKPLSEFYRNMDTRDGFSAKCKSCLPKQTMEYRLNRNYKLTSEWYDKMLISQDNKCAICRADFLDKKPNIDHDHNTGLIRGLLCSNCNTALGLMKDSINNLKMAIKYLGETK